MLVTLRPTSTLCQVSLFCKPPRIPNHFVNMMWRSALSMCRHSRGMSTMAQRSSLVSATMDFPGVHRIAHWTDAEGNWDYFCKLVDRSEAVDWGDDAKRSLKLKPGCALVYGGDCFDKGPGDLRISAALVGLKQAAPERTVLLLGNRDVNKMRFRAELDSSDIARDFGTLPPPFWIANGQHSESTRHLVEACLQDNTPINRLHYILRGTMGASDTFEHRRTELALLQGAGGGAVDDEEVFASFVSAAQSGGAYHNYIMHAQLAAVWGNTLFIHGGMTALSCGYVLPYELRWKRNTEDEVNLGRHTAGNLTVQEWVGALDEVMTTSLARWDADPLWNEQRTKRAGENLMAYAHSAATLGRSVMVSTFQIDGNLAVAPPEVKEYLQRDGIHRTVVGHKPCGEVPGIVRSPNFEQVCSDTSFSDTTARDSRGLAVSEVLIEGEPHYNQVRVHGVLADGRAVDFYTPPTGDPATASPDVVSSMEKGDQLVGSRLDNGYWVRAPIAASPGTYTTTLAAGYHTEVQDHHVSAGSL